MHLPIPQVSKSELAAGEEVEVTLKGTGFLTMEPFMGFLIQVQPPSIGWVDYRFVSPISFIS